MRVECALGPTAKGGARKSAKLCFGERRDKTIAKSVQRACDMSLSSVLFAQASARGRFTAAFPAIDPSRRVCRTADRAVDVVTSSADSRASGPPRVSWTFAIRFSRLFIRPPRLTGPLALRSFLNDGPLTAAYNRRVIEIRNIRHDVHEVFFLFVPSVFFFFTPTTTTRYGHECRLFG